jgi:hypothetical protein
MEPSMSRFRPTPSHSSWSVERAALISAGRGRHVSKLRYVTDPSKLNLCRKPVDPGYELSLSNSIQGKVDRKEDPCCRWLTSTNL